VTQYPVPIAGFGQSLGCNGIASSFSDSSTISSGKISLWNWNFGDKSTSTSENPSHNYLKSGPYTLKLIVISSYGCKDSISKPLRIQPEPTAAFTYKNACVGALIYTANNSKDSTNKSTYNWNFGDGFTSASVAPTHVYTASGSYKISLITTSANGCANNVSQTITPYPKPDVKLDYSRACNGMPVNLVDTGASLNGFSYYWRFGDGASATTNTDTTSHIYKNNGSYNLALTITNTNGCIDSEKVSITVADLPAALFTTANVCEYNQAIFTNTSPGGSALNYLWKFGDNSSSLSTINATHNYKAPGNYTVKLAAINGGCADTFSAPVIIYPAPVIAPWTEKQNNHYTVTFIPNDTSIGTFKWYFGNNTNDSSSKKEPVFLYTSGPGKYQVKLVVTNKFGCISEKADTLVIGKSGIGASTDPDYGISVFPNPFEGITNISYVLPIESKVNICVFDMQGRLVARLKDGVYQAGNYADVFDVNKYDNVKGIYLLKIILNDSYYIAKIVNIK
jgi:PKD repeat protein